MACYRVIFTFTFTTGDTRSMNGTGLKMRASGWGVHHSGPKVTGNFSPEWTTSSFPKMNSIPWNQLSSLDITVSRTRTCTVGHSSACDLRKLRASVHYHLLSRYEIISKALRLENTLKRAGTELVCTLLPVCKSCSH